MITDFLITIFTGIVNGILSVVPNVTIASLPTVGQTLSDTLLSMVTTWNAFMATFPYAQTAWDLFLFVIIPFELIMLGLKFILGHHVPAHLN